MVIFDPLAKAPTKNQCSDRSTVIRVSFLISESIEPVEASLTQAAGKSQDRAAPLGRVGCTDRKTHWVSVGSVLFLQPCTDRPQ